MGMELLDYDRATVLVCGSLEVSSDVEEWANWSATKSGPYWVWYYYYTDKISEACRVSISFLGTERRS